MYCASVMMRGGDVVEIVFRRFYTKCNPTSLIVLVGGWTKFCGDINSTRETCLVATIYTEIRKIFIHKACNSIVLM